MIEDCLSIIASFICEVALKMILQKIYFYYTYFVARYQNKNLVHYKRNGTDHYRRGWVFLVIKFKEDRELQGLLFKIKFGDL